MRTLASSFGLGSFLLLLAACSASDDAGPSRRSGSGGSGGGSAGSSSVGGTAGTAGSSSSGGATGGSDASGGSTASGGTGGSDASGGSTASGGTGGSDASGGSGGSGGSSVNAVVTDDFESAALGGPPNPSLFSVRGSGTVQISNEVTRPGGGAQVVKVVGTSGATMFVNNSVFPLPAGVVHFRVYMRFTSADWAGHIGFVAAGPGQESQEVRFGGQNGFYHANLAADGDGLSPDPFLYPQCMIKSSGGPCVPPVADEWVCLRGMFDFPGHKARLYVNDALAVDAEADSVRDDWHSGTGMLPQNPTEIAFGWAIYGGTQNTVYYDDLAIGYEPIPCL